MVVSDDDDSVDGVVRAAPVETIDHSETIDHVETVASRRSPLRYHQTDQKLHHYYQP